MRGKRFEYFFQIFFFHNLKISIKSNLKLFLDRLLCSHNTVEVMILSLYRPFAFLRQRYGPLHRITHRYIVNFAVRSPL